jgi:predicted alpha/beta-fold hydrolase
MLASSRWRRARVLREAAEFAARSEDQVADCGDGTRLLLHHTAPRGPGGRLAVLIHGWEGSGNATYMMSAGAALWASGCRVIRLNLRDHGASHHLNRELFHSCRLDEVIGAVRWVQQCFPGEELLLGGYSLGGNFALRVAARAREAGLSIRRVAAVCPVLDPEETMHALDGGLPVYRWYFIRKWRRSLRLKRDAFPDAYDFGDLGRFRTLQAMTDFFVREYTEYPDLLTYLRGYALTGDRLAGLSVPARLLLAADDPVVPAAGMARLARPGGLEVHRSAWGGHCGFLTGFDLARALDDYMAAALEVTPDSRNRAA